MKMKSIARLPFKYAGTLVQPQSEFSVKSARDAKLLTAMHRAALVVEPVAATAKPVPAKRTYKRRDMQAEAPTEAAAVAPIAEQPVDDLAE